MTKVKELADLSIPMKRENLYRFFLSFIVALLAGLQLIPYVSWEPYDLARHGLLAEDAYFYSELAENLLQYNFLTFDGEMTTNGFQPLWMGVQAFLTLLFPSMESVTLLAFSSWFCYVLFAFLIVWYVNNRNPSLANFLSTVTLAGLIILQYAFQASVVQGLETPLMLLMLTLALLMFDRTLKKMRFKTSDQVRWEVSWLALFASLVFLSRTDLFWFPIVIFLWLLVHERRISANLVLFSSIVTLLVVPYLVFNLLHEESLVPISGRVKIFYMNTFFPDWESYFRSNEWHGPYQIFDSVFFLNALPVHKGVRYIIALIMISGALFIVWRYRNSRFFPASIKLLGTVVLLHLLYMQLFYRELRPYTAYYFMPEVLFFVLALAFYTKKLFLCSNKGIQFSFKLQRLRIYAREHGYLFIVAMSAIVFSGAWIKYELHPHPSWVERVNLAEDISRMVPEHEKVGAFWPGLFAQFSDRQIVPLDGIIGSNEYFQKYVKTGREIDYLLEKDVRFLAIYLPKDFNKAFSSNEEPEIHHWSRLGFQRLWKNRHYITKILSARPIQSSNSAWYLIEVDPSAELKVSQKAINGQKVNWQP